MCRSARSADEGGPHFSEDEVRAYIETEFHRGLGSRPPWISVRPSPNDNFPGSSSLENAPDLSLMAKARLPWRSRCADYIASLLTHYNGSEQEQAGTFLYGNDTYGGGYLSMAPPLDDGWVEYQDGTEATLEQMSMDVAAFLMWTAEPHLAARKQMGLTAVIILGLFSVLLYLTNKAIWAPVKARVKGDTPAE